MRISVNISEGTKRLLERYSRAHGGKKQYLIESALLHYIHALEQLPPGVIVPPRLVVSAAGSRKIATVLAKGKKPTHDLVELMSEHSRAALRTADHRKLRRRALSADPQQSFKEIAAELRKMTANRKQTPSEILQREGRDER
jgi:hypothetical protein